MGNNNSVSRVVIFLIFKIHSRATLPSFLPTARWLKNRLSRCTTSRNLRMILQAFCPYAELHAPFSVNDLPKCSSSLDFILFADDTNIICSNDDPDTLETVLNKDLHIISNWFKLNKLSLNVAKTNYMISKNKTIPLLLA